MRCPSCGFPESKVVDSRPVEEGSLFVADENVFLVGRVLLPMNEQKQVLF